MAFITSNGNVISFAEYSDMTAMDSRFFEANEGQDSVVVEDILERATVRILTEIQNTDWWRNYYVRLSGVSETITIYTNTFLAVPPPSANKIKARQADFTDLACYYAWAYMLLPKVANFGAEDTAERQKMSWYDERYRKRFEELINAGDWYDFSGDNVIASTEKQPTRVNLQRVR